MKGAGQTNCLKITSFQYDSGRSKTSRKSQTERNPIKIVIDKIGANGRYEQHIVNQYEELMRQAERVAQSKLHLANSLRAKKSKMEMLSNVHSLQSIDYHHQHHKQQMVRSHVFNRYHYDNYSQIPNEARLSIHLPKRRVSDLGHKNIQVVFCENKLPDFVSKTNDKIEEIYKEQQKKAHQQNLNFISTHIAKDKPSNSFKKGIKTTLANCIKEYSTLEKLSFFMESDQNLREKCLHFEVQKDPSRTLLLDVVTHRFSFMKQVSRVLRENIYHCLLSRDIIAHMKINIQQYMRFYQMFIGRDAGAGETSTMIYLLLFGDRVPAIELARQVIYQTRGPLNKQRAVLQLIYVILQQPIEKIVGLISENDKLMRLFIDLIVEK